ncbi:MAG: hypothetical protein ACFB8W_21130 [Elainellaceae cyanobacterium]
MSEMKATYTEQLHSWCVVRSLPVSKPQIVARFRRRGDAEMHLKVVQRLSPGVVFGIVFDGGGR